MTGFPSAMTASQPVLCERIHTSIAEGEEVLPLSELRPIIDAAPTTHDDTPHRTNKYDVHPPD